MDSGKFRLKMLIPSTQYAFRSTQSLGLRRKASCGLTENSEAGIQIRHTIYDIHNTNKACPEHGRRERRVMEIFSERA